MENCFICIEDKPSVSFIACGTCRQSICFCCIANSYLAKLQVNINSEYECVFCRTSIDYETYKQRENEVISILEITSVESYSFDDDNPCEEEITKILEKIRKIEDLISP